VDVISSEISDEVPVCNEKKMVACGMTRRSGDYSVNSVNGFGEAPVREESVQQSSAMAVITMMMIIIIMMMIQ
jgi:hypothetical protein